ncbi:MAG: hypothetical protein EA376_00475 [Phycisphaeraceae bacterium]|nr:MAG: hypothetical protein EA376_00475 [Phycisphaeraceae bacterium]
MSLRRRHGRFVLRRPPHTPQPPHRPAPRRRRRILRPPACVGCGDSSPTCGPWRPCWPSWCASSSGPSSCWPPSRANGWVASKHPTPR